MNTVRKKNRAVDRATLSMKNAVIFRAAGKKRPAPINPQTTIKLIVHHHVQPVRRSLVKPKSKPCCNFCIESGLQKQNETTIEIKNAFSSLMAGLAKWVRAVPTYLTLIRKTRKSYATAKQFCKNFPVNIRLIPERQTNRKKSKKNKNPNISVVNILSSEQVSLLNALFVTLNATQGDLLKAETRILLENDLTKSILPEMEKQKFIERESSYFVRHEPQHQDRAMTSR